MKVLLIKTSSMGDLIHTLPALTDAGKAIPEIEFDWVSEQSFREIPNWHARVRRVIPIQLRKWRRHPWQAWQSGEVSHALRELKQDEYDLILDAQGLLKSAIVARCARGPRAGLDRRSLREPIASLFYQKRYRVARDQHAVTRTRRLFAQALGYRFEDSVPDYAIDEKKLPPSPIANENPYLVFLHGTTWQTKHWPQDYWQQLVNFVTSAGITVYLPWGNAHEQQRAEWLARESQHAIVLPRCQIGELASLLKQARGVVAVDTGLGHLCAALEIPTISLYGPTDPERTGTHGANQFHLAANFSCSPCLQESCSYTNKHTVLPPCFSTVSVDAVWNKLQNLLA